MLLDGSGALALSGRRGRDFSAGAGSQVSLMKRAMDRESAGESQRACPVQKQIPASCFPYKFFKKISSLSGYESCLA